MDGSYLATKYRAPDEITVDELVDEALDPRHPFKSSGTYFEVDWDKNHIKRYKKQLPPVLVEDEDDD